MISLLNKMTVEEKLGQLVQIAPFFFVRDLKNELYGPATELGLSLEQIFLTGSVLGIGSPEEMIEVQKRYLDNSRLKIPLLFMADIIHGYQTIFPIPLAMACSFNPELIKTMARISAVEAQTSGIHITFSPMADIVRDPRWGRVMESFGEDPYLNYVLSYYAVKGYQNDNITKEGSLGACAKHFAGYGLVESGREYNTVDISEYALRQYFLAGYQGAIDAGAVMMMTSFNLFEGIPATMNEKLLKEILRKEMEFKGVIISDYNGLKETMIHGISSSEKEAALNCMKAGLDIEMVSGNYILRLKEDFDSGKLPMSLLDEACLRVLNLKKEIGLFDNPFKGVSRDKHNEVVLSKKHLDEALKVAYESIVLLKNDKDVLPIIAKNKVYACGPNLHTNNLNGAWSWHGKSNSNETYHDVLKEKCNIVKNFEESDYIVYFGGEKFNESGEAKSKTNIDFPIEQLEEIIKLKEMSKPIILVINAGRPLVLTAIEKHVDSILYSWFLGTKNALAVVGTLIGDNNPSGKLAISFPRALGQVPVYYNHLPTGRPKNDYDNEYTTGYIDSENDPLYCFGFGLSYSKFEYDELIIKETTVEDDFTLKINVKNDSFMPGFETIQLYIKDTYAHVSRPVKELKSFQKIWFNSNEVKEVSFKITKEMFEYFDNKSKRKIDHGEFIVYVGSSSSNVKMVKINYVGKEK
ncbi:MAG: glycoside hydrolase family 3 N-terminal domain-containing protein [Acholeplasma sp.]|nr:glycoside hydrolase family 3 N-terminal domain-containing protein [Acholeplasma sp.]